MDLLTIQKVTSNGKHLPEDFKERLIAKGFHEEERGYVISLNKLNQSNVR